MVTMKLVVVHVVFDSPDPKVPAVPNDPAAGYGGGRECCGYCQLSIALYATFTSGACLRLPLWFIHLKVLEDLSKKFCVGCSYCQWGGVLLTQKSKVGL